MLNETKKYFVYILNLVYLIFGTLFFSAKADIAIEKEKRPKVSVIVPVYRVEPWIRECMDSLVNQTLKDIDIICVDDGSPDNCGKILDEYSKKDSRVKVIHQKNGGLSRARNAGLDIATGEYITFVDSDDYLDLRAYEFMYKYAKKDNVDILSFGYRKFEDKQDDHINNIDFSDSKVMSTRDFISNRKYKKFYICYMFKYKVIQDYKLRFVENLKHVEDTCFLFMALGNAKKIKVIPAKFYNYRQRPGSLVRVARKRGIKRWNDIVNAEMFRKICESWKQQNCLKNREEDLITLIIQWLPVNERNLVCAQEILEQIGSDILNPENVKKCPDYIQDHIKKLEYSALSNKNPPLKDGVYRICSAVNNYKSCLDINEASKENGANLQLWNENKSPAQNFLISKRPEGYYTIKALCSGKMLDVNKASKKSGTNVQQYESNGGQAQYWYIIPCNDGSFSIISACNLLAMDVSGGKTDNGTNIQCWKINGSNAQKFKFVQ